MITTGVIHFYPCYTEITLVQGKLLAVVPRLSTEWILKYSMNVKSLQTTVEYCNFVQLSLANDFSGATYGSRVALLYLRAKGLEATFQIMIFASAINSATRYKEMSELPRVGEWEHYEFHQRYVSGGDYRFFVKRNGEEVYSVINTDAQQFYDVKVWASNPSASACQADIRNLELTNFL